MKVAMDPEESVVSNTTHKEDRPTRIHKAPAYLCDYE